MLSAMLRVKNEEQWIGPCLQSILPWFDEVVVCLQNCTDATESIVRALNDPKIQVHHYPYDSWPNGEGYAQQNPHHPQSRTYFYNWCLERCSGDYVCKWDADMVAFDWLGNRIHDLLTDDPETIWFYGVDIVGKELKHVGERVFCATEPRVFKRTARTYYVNGTMCERLQTSGGGGTVIPEPAFLHFKWAKPMNVATQAWPEGWEQSSHFQNIIKRAMPVREYTGEYPSCIVGM